MAKKDDAPKLDESAPEASQAVDAANDTVTAPEQPQQQLRIDESGTQTFYSSTTRIWGTPEELIVDFTQGIRPTGQENVAVMKVDARVVMSPYAAKRLALALGQNIQRYEQTFGVLEVDPRKRMQSGATTTAS